MIKGPFNEGSLSKAITDAIKGNQQIERTGSYQPWANDMIIFKNPSDNHWGLGKVADEVNLANGFPTVLSAADIKQKAITHCAGDTIDLRELYERGPYLVWNLEGYRTSRDLWRMMGDNDLAQAHHVKLRSICAALALSTDWTSSPRTLIASELVHYGPAVVTAAGPSKAKVVLPPAVEGGVRKTFDFDFTGLPSTACCGVRSANTKQEGTAGKSPDPKRDGPPAWRDWPGELTSKLVWDILTQPKNSQGRPLEARANALANRGGLGFWLLPEEATVLRKASHGDMNCIMIALDWLKQGLPRNPFRIIRSDDYVIMACLSAPGAPTATLYVVVVEIKTGVHKFIVADPGDRHNIKSGNCQIIIAGGTITYKVQRDDKSLPAATYSHPIVNIYLDVEFGGADKRWIVHSSPLPVPPPPVVDPPPSEEKPKSNNSAFIVGGAVVLIVVLVMALSC